MNNLLEIGLAFWGGIISILSPCTLVLIPSYTAYFAAQNEGKRLVSKIIGFVLGFSIVFIIMGASATAISEIFLMHKALFRKIGGIIIILFGIHMMGLLKIKALYKDKRLIENLPEGNKFGSFLLGMAFAAGWTACTGPILASILIYAGSSMNVIWGIILLFVYSLGMSISFILVAVASRWLGWRVSRFSKVSFYIQKASGAILMVFGLIMFTNKLVYINSYLNGFGR